MIFLSDKREKKHLAKVFEKIKNFLLLPGIGGIIRSALNLPVSKMLGELKRLQNKVSFLNETGFNRAL